MYEYILSSNCIYVNHGLLYVYYICLNCDITICTTQQCIFSGMSLKTLGSKVTGTTGYCYKVNFMQFVLHNNYIQLCNKL